MAPSYGSCTHQWRRDPRWRRRCWTDRARWYRTTPGCRRRWSSWSAPAGPPSGWRPSWSRSELGAGTTPGGGEGEGPRCGPSCRSLSVENWPSWTSSASQRRRSPVRSPTTKTTTIRWHYSARAVWEPYRQLPWWRAPARSGQSEHNSSTTRASDFIRYSGLHNRTALFTLCAKLSGAVLWRAGRQAVFVGGSVTTITRNCVHRSSPNWVCR